MMLSTLGLAVALAVVPVQPPEGAIGPIALHLEHISPTVSDAAAARFAQAPRDPLTNGARIGAIVGGLISGVAVAYLCHTFNDDDSLPCWKPVALWTAIGAGGGALAGAGFDALFQRRVAATWTVRF